MAALQRSLIVTSFAKVPTSHDKVLTDPLHTSKMQDGQGDNAMGMASMMREVQELAEKFKVEEDEQYVSPYAHLEKAAVLQEAR